MRPEPLYTFERANTIGGIADRCRQEMAARADASRVKVADFDFTSLTVAGTDLRALECYEVVGGNGKRGIAFAETLIPDLQYKAAFTTGEFLVLKEMPRIVIKDIVVPKLTRNDWIALLGKINPALTQVFLRKCHASYIRTGTETVPHWMVRSFLEEDGGGPYNTLLTSIAASPMTLTPALAMLFIDIIHAMLMCYGDYDEITRVPVAVALAWYRACCDAPHELCFAACIETRVLQPEKQVRLPELSMSAFRWVRTQHRFARNITPVHSQAVYLYHGVFADIAARSGHTAIASKELATNWKFQKFWVPSGAWLSADEQRYWQSIGTASNNAEALQFLLEHKILVHDKESDQMALSVYYNAEKIVADMLVKIHERWAHSQPAVPDTSPEPLHPAMVRLVDEQVDLAAMIRNHFLAIGDGAGGCGKTETACVALAGSPGNEVCACAPTARMASQLAAKLAIGIPGIACVRTVDSMISRLTNDDGTLKPVRVLLVDECSMLSVQKLAQLLKAAVERTAVSKLVFLGDTRQLPSIDPGAVLRDFVAAMGNNRIELRRNHRHAQALVLGNLVAMIRNRAPIADIRAAIAQEGSPFRVIDMDDAPPNTYAPIRGWNHLKVFNARAAPGDEAACKHETVRGAVRQRLAQFLFETQYTPDNTIVVAFTREDARDANITARTVYRNMPACVPETSFDTGDLITARVNSILPLAIPAEAEGLECVCVKSPNNSEIGFSMINGELYDVTSRETLRMTSKAGRPYSAEIVRLYVRSHGVTVPVFLAHLHKARVALGYARTVHTAQGMEGDRVVVVAGSADKKNAFHPEGVYTAVSRGKREVVVLQRENLFWRALENMLGVNEPRTTNLARCIHRALPTLSTYSPPAPPPPDDIFSDSDSDCLDGPPAKRCNNEPDMDAYMLDFM